MPDVRSTRDPAERDPERALPKRILRVVANRLPLSVLEGDLKVPRPRSLALRIRARMRRSDG